MLFEITLRGTEDAPATDLGYLLHKNPFRAEPQSFRLAFGQAHVFWPEATAERSTAALLLEVDPIGLVRRPAGGEGFALAQYVNDRPYVASSFLAVAIGEVYGTALAGRSKERQALAEVPLPLAARLAVVPCRGGEEFLQRLLAPLGYEVVATRHPLDERFPEWGEGPYHTVELQAEARLRDLLAHLTVLIPVLDGAKHYYVGDDEVDKLLRRGAGWLRAHPERELIATRYLKHRRSLVRDAVARLIEEETPGVDDTPDDAGGDSAVPALDEPVPAEEERQPGLHRQRLEAVLAELRASGARRVLDLGCGEGRLLRLLLAEPQFTEIVGLDVSHRSLEMARDRLKLDRLPLAKRERVRLLHGALTYRDARLRGFDAAAVVEVIEHLDPWRLDAFACALFGEARPGTVILTTPNREYNVRWPNLPAGDRRHADHRFEWTRAEFRAWADGVGERFDFAVRYAGVGPEDMDVGAPSQMAIFTMERGSG